MNRLLKITAALLLGVTAMGCGKASRTIDAEQAKAEAQRTVMSQVQQAAIQRAQSTRPGMTRTSR